MVHLRFQSINFHFVETLRHAGEHKGIGLNPTGRLNSDAFQQSANYRRFRQALRGVGYYDALW